MKRSAPPSAACPISFGVLTSINLRSANVFLIDFRSVSLILNIAAVLGFLRSKALASSLLSKLEKTLPVGSIGKGGFDLRKDSEFLS